MFATLDYQKVSLGWLSFPGPARPKGTGKSRRRPCRSLFRIIQRSRQHERPCLSTQIFENMVKPAFIFDGRNTLNHAALREVSQQGEGTLHCSNALSAASSLPSRTMLTLGPPNSPVTDWLHRLRPRQAPGPLPAVRIQLGWAAWRNKSACPVPCVPCVSACALTWDMPSLG